MKHRLFIAISPPEAIKQRIHDLQSRLNRENFPILWEPPAKLHLTLNYVGNLDEEYLPHLHRAIKITLSQFSPFTLTLSYLETLYQRHEPSLIYLAPAGDLQPLKELQKSLRIALNELRHPQSNRFLPHLTIGRLKRTDPTAAKNFLDQIGDTQIEPLPGFTVDSVILYESFLSRQGSTYQQAQAFML